MAYDDQYGNSNPPYSLYQSEYGLWGLIDRDGVKLPAVFSRVEDRFSCVPWEVVSFNPDEGFDLLSWYDPSEVWFNFTFNDSRYPDEFGAYLWKSPCDISDYETEIRKLLPAESHWIIEYLHETNRIIAIDDDKKYINAIYGFINQHPQVLKMADFNQCLDPVMRDDTVSEEIKTALWQAKITLDYNVKQFIDDIETQYCDFLWKN